MRFGTKIIAISLWCMTNAIQTTTNGFIGNVSYKSIVLGSLSLLLLFMLSIFSDMQSMPRSVIFDQYKSDLQTASVDDSTTEHQGTQMLSSLDLNSNQSATNENKGDV